MNDCCALTNRATFSIAKYSLISNTHSCQAAARVDVNEVRAFSESDPGQI